MGPLSCCVTGHRCLPPELLGHIEEKLREEIESAIDGGYLHFVSGFARGVDMMFARLVLEAKEGHPEITLEAALPYEGWMDHRSKEDRALLDQCGKVQAHSVRNSSRCFSARNRYMVETCLRVIGVYDGRKKGGTANTLRYADLLDRDIRKIMC